MKLPEETSNDRHIREIGECNGDPACIAIRQSEHFARITAKIQLDPLVVEDIQRVLTTLVQRFIAHETHYNEQVRIGREDRTAIREHLDQIDQRIVDLVPADEIRALIASIKGTV